MVKPKAKKIHMISQENNSAGTQGEKENKPRLVTVKDEPPLSELHVDESTSRMPEAHVTSKIEEPSIEIGAGPSISLCVSKQTSEFRVFAYTKVAPTSGNVSRAKGQQIDETNSNSLEMKIEPPEEQLSEPCTDGSSFPIKDDLLEVELECDAGPASSNVAVELMSECLVKDEFSDEEEENDEVDLDDKDDSDYEPEGDALDVADCDEVWTTEPCVMKSITFSRRSKFLVPPPHEPYEVFRLLLEDDLLDLIAMETNTYAHKQDTKKLWKDITRNHLLKFFGLLIHTGTMRMYRYSEYWKRHRLYNLTCFSKYMPANQFMMILRCLHCSFVYDHDDQENIQPIIDHFNNKMESIYYPGENLTVKQSLSCPKSVRALHVLAEPDGIALKIQATHGVVDSKKIIFDLLERKLDCGHAVYVNRQYNSKRLAESLLERNTYCTGPLGKRRVPQNIRNDTKPQQNLISYFLDGVHICKSEDKFNLSTQFGDECLTLYAPHTKCISELKPTSIVMYKKMMSKDLRQELMEYPCCPKALKWFRKLFIHVLQLILKNAYLMWTKFHRKKRGFREFRLKILEKLLPTDDMGMVDTSSDPNSKLSHILTKIEKTRFRQRWENGHEVFRKEVVRKECQGCRQQKKRVATTFECRQCEGYPGFCMECFCRMHSSHL